MGAHYGSVQVRSDDRDRVKAVAETVARLMKIRMLVAPAVNGWIAIFPEGNGQDERVGREIAKRIDGTLLQLMVHDDSIFAYWLYRNGEGIDSYWSKPGYFGEKHRAEQEKMAGDPEVFRLIIHEKVDLLPAILSRQNTPVMASNQLEEFAKVLGISNSLNAYEYAKQGELIGIEDRNQLEEIPADRIAKEQEAKLAAQNALTTKRLRLRSEGLLLLSDERSGPMPLGCTLSDGFVVAWPDHLNRTVEYAEYREPWDKPHSLTIETPTHITGIAGNASGHRVALAAGDRAQVWDVVPGKGKHVIDILESDLAVGVSISPDGTRLAHASRNGIFVTEVATNQLVLACPTKSGSRMAFHPSGDWLVVDGYLLGVVALREEPSWRELYVGSKSATAGKEAVMFQAALRKLGVDAMEKKIRSAVEQMIGKLAKDASQSEKPAISEAKIEAARRKMEETIVAMKAGRIPQTEPLKEHVKHVGFSRDGRWLWLGTNLGLRVYEWSAVPRETGAVLTQPTWSFEFPDRPSHPPSNYVYAIVEEADAPAITFGGITGRLYRLDLLTGQTRELVKLPTDCWILELCMSADGKALGIGTCEKPLDRHSQNESRCAWEVWSYPRLLGDLSRNDQVEVKRAREGSEG